MLAPPTRAPLPFRAVGIGGRRGDRRPLRLPHLRVRVSPEHFLFFFVPALLRGLREAAFPRGKQEARGDEVLLPLFFLALLLLLVREESWSVAVALGRPGNLRLDPFLLLLLPLPLLRAGQDSQLCLLLGLLGRRGRFVCRDFPQLERPGDAPELADEGLLQARREEVGRDGHPAGGWAVRRLQVQREALGARIIRGGRGPEGHLPFAFLEPYPELRLHHFQQGEPRHVPRQLIPGPCTRPRRRRRQRALAPGGGRGGRAGRERAPHPPPRGSRGR